MPLPVQSAMPSPMPSTEGLASSLLIQEEPPYWLEWLSLSLSLIKLFFMLRRNTAGWVHPGGHRAVGAGSIPKLGKYWKKPFYLRHLACSQMPVSSSTQKFCSRETGYEQRALHACKHGRGCMQAKLLSVGSHDPTLQGAWHTRRRLSMTGMICCC